MSKLLATLSTVLLFIKVCLAQNLNCTLETKIPELDPEEWWGPGQKGPKDSTVRPFRIRFDREMVLDLRQRIWNHRSLTPSLKGTAFQYGFNTGIINEWLYYWAEEYDFEEREEFLNMYPHFLTNIQGLDVHFIRVRPKVPPGVKVLPLILIHGWPGSVREFYEAIPLLTRPRAGYDFVFEVIIPSIPGFGYSDAASRPGLGPSQAAVIFKNLMERLGHKQFYVQGGDWGSVVGSELATLFPKTVLGFHSNFIYVLNRCAGVMYLFGSVFPSALMDPNLAYKLYPVSSFFGRLWEGFGYYHLQATKPDSIGVALTDSPAGLLAYILEKFALWTNQNNKFLEDGGLENTFSKDQLLDNLMLYWAPNKITTSMRFYRERANTVGIGTNDVITTVPTWGYQAKYENVYQPPIMLRIKYVNLLNTTVTEEGGHFLALELPHDLVADVFRAVEAFREFNAKAID